MNNIALNDVALRVIDVEQNLVEDKREISFSFVTNGENEFNLHKNLFSNKILDAKLEDGTEFKVRVPSWSYSLKDEDYSEIPFRINLREIDEDESDWDVSSGATAYALQSMLLLDTVKEVLIRKGIITDDELQSINKEVIEKNHQKRMNYLLTGDENKEYKED